MFDHAKSLERGRRGRQLSNMLAPDLAAALQAYEAATAAIDATVSREGDVARVLEGYAARAAAVREQLGAAEAKVRVRVRVRVRARVRARVRVRVRVGVRVRVRV